MSLITLKNDANQKPWNFRNYFRDPLIIKPKSSVSFQSAVINKGNTINTLDNNAFYQRAGVVGLNPVSIMKVDVGQDQWTPDQLAGEMKEELETFSSQPSYSNDALGQPYGWEVVYDNDDQKMTISNTQEPCPAEQAPTQFAPNTPYFTSTAIADYLRITRSGAVGIPTQISIGGANTASPVVPRNAGHFIFKPAVDAGTGNFPSFMRLGLGPSTLNNSMFAYWSSPAGQANPNTPQNTIEVEFYGGPAPRVQVYLNEGDMLNQIRTAKGVPYQTVPANPILAIAFEWNGPYSMIVKYSTNYDPTAPGTNYANAVWTTLYDMLNDGGITKSIPTFQDNFIPSLYMRGANAIVDVRGTTHQDSAQAGKYDWSVEGWSRDNDVFVIKDNFNIGTDAFAGAYPNIFLNKTISILMDTEDPAFTMADRAEWEEGMVIPLEDTRLGRICGYADDVVILDSILPFQLADAEADNVLVIGNHLPQLHIQLTNFAIESKNGVVSNNVKDIKVIPLFSENNDPASNQLYNEAPYENKINLNNLETLTLNQIDVLITTDNNTQATFLDNDSSIVIKIHQGIEEEASK